MKIKLDEEFLVIAEEILAENKSIEEWSEIESDDMFQSGPFVGGFDGIEKEFCFSYESVNGEYWFQLPLSSMQDVVRGKVFDIEVRPAE